MISRLWFMLYCWLFGPRPVTPRARRSPLWRKVRREHLRREPACQWCGAGEAGGGVIARVIRALIRSLLQVHHILPFHARPDLELDPNNLITLCPKCHLKYGHLGNYLVSNPRIREDCAAHRAQRTMTQRKTRGVEDAGGGGGLLLLLFLFWAAPVVLGALVLVVGWAIALYFWPAYTLVASGILAVILFARSYFGESESADEQPAKTARSMPGAIASAGALAGGALSILQWLESIRQHWLRIAALLLLVVIPAGALLVCGWLWLFERCPTITLVASGVIPAIVGGIYITLRKISAHVI